MNPRTSPMRYIGYQPILSMRKLRFKEVSYLTRGAELVEGRTGIRTQVLEPASFSRASPSSGTKDFSLAQNVSSQGCPAAYIGFCISLSSVRLQLMGNNSADVASGSQGFLGFSWPYWVIPVVVFQRQGFPMAFAASAKVARPPGTSELVNKIGI